MRALSFLKSLKTHLDAEEQAKIALDMARKSSRNKRPGSATASAAMRSTVLARNARTMGLQLMAAFGLTHARLCKASIQTLEVPPLCL
jgi:hypothetical protein